MAKFEKGQSGNPGGRPKIVKLIQELAQEHSEEAFEKIVYLMNHAEDERVQLAAAKEIQDRAWGKPAQAVEVSGKDGGPLIAVINVGTKPKNQ